MTSKSRITALHSFPDAEGAEEFVQHILDIDPADQSLDPPHHFAQGFRHKFDPDFPSV